MANPVVVLDDTLYDIADAIRSKTGGTADMTPSEMPAQIASIPSGGSVGIPREVNQNGVYRIPQQSFSFSLPANATDLGNWAFYYAFRQAKLVSVDMGSLTTVSGQSALGNAFEDCSSLTSANFRSLTEISGITAFQNAFLGCSGLTSIVFESLSSVSGGQALFHAFQGCSNLTSADFRSLTTVSGGSKGFGQTFQFCRSLTSVNLSALTTITGSQAFYFAFQGCTSLTSLSFPALTPSSFGSNTNQFNYMLSGVTGCTVHFPAAIQSTIGSWSDVQNGFDGTNTTVLFDL